MTPQVLAIIRVEFATSERPIAIGLYGASMGLASITAQLLGGLLVSLNLFGWSWRLIFLVNIPIGLIAITLVSRMIRESRGSNRATLDLVGVALASLGLFLLIYPIVEGREAGWPAWSFAMLATMVPVLVGFVLYERHVIRSRPDAADRVASVSDRYAPARPCRFDGLLQHGRRLLCRADRVSSGRSGLVGIPGRSDVLALRDRILGVIDRLRPDRQQDRPSNHQPRHLPDGAWPVGHHRVGPNFDHCRRISAPSTSSCWSPIFFIYGLGQGLAQPALINTVIGGAGVTGEDAGSAVGLFLTTAQSVIALGVAAIGDVFFSWLSETPTTATYLERADRLARLQLRAHGRDVLFGAAASSARGGTALTGTRYQLIRQGDPS